jgi:hypothetical protein
VEQIFIFTPNKGRIITINIVTDFMYSPKQNRTANIIVHPQDNTKNSQTSRHNAKQYISQDLDGLPTVISETVTDCLSSVS